MAGFNYLLSRLIPFADPTRPILYDILYSAAICSFLYLAPQIDFSRLRQNIQTTLHDQHPTTLPRLWTAVRASFNPLPHHIPTNIPPNRAPDLDAVAAADPPDDPAEDAPDAPNDHLPHLPPLADLLEHAPRLRDLPPLPPGAAADQDQDIAALIADLEAADTHAPGPAAQQQQQPRRQRDPNRVVGAKKAKSLARRDQRRSYNEFMRQQGNLQRARERRLEEVEREEQRGVREERERVEREIEERKERERRERREREEGERRREVEDVRRVVEIVQGEGVGGEGVEDGGGRGEEGQGGDNGGGQFHCQSN